MTTPNPWLETFTVNSGYAQPSFQTNSAIIGLANGGFVVTWADDDWNSTGSGNEWDIAAKIFDAEGNVVRDSYQLNSASGDIWISSVVPTHDGFAMLYYVTDEDGFGYFPDSVSERASRHMMALSALVSQGHRADVVFVDMHGCGSSAYF